jgi:hypothetical protein
LSPFLTSVGAATTTASSIRSAPASSTRVTSWRSCPATPKNPPSPVSRPGGGPGARRLGVLCGRDRFPRRPVLDPDQPRAGVVADDAAVAGGNGMMLALGGVAFGLLGAALGALGGRKLVGAGEARGSSRRRTESDAGRGRRKLHRRTGRAPADLLGHHPLDRGAALRRRARRGPETEGYGPNVGSARRPRASRPPRTRPTSASI